MLFNTGERIGDEECHHSCGLFEADAADVICEDAHSLAVLLQAFSRSAGQTRIDLHCDTSARKPVEELFHDLASPTTYIVNTIINTQVARVEQMVKARD